MRKISILAALVLASCVGGTDGEHDERFTGMWVVDQPGHAGYEATVYEFDAFGIVRALDACDFSGLGDDYVTGSVESEFGIRCEFGGGWQSNGPNQLVVAGDCDDDRIRAIALGFDSNTSLNAEGTNVVVVSVDGQSGWEHRDFAWRWTRCPDTGCAPVWFCP